MTCPFHEGQLVILSRTVRFTGHIGTVQKIFQTGGECFLRVCVEVGLRRVGPGTHMIVCESVTTNASKLDAIP